MSFRKLERGELDHEIIWSAILALAVFVAFALPTKLFWSLYCPFKVVTGIPCAGCGSTRSLMALREFEIVTALATNPLFTLLALAWAAFALYGTAAVTLRLPRLRIDNNRVAQRLAWMAGLAILLNWVYLVAAGI